MCGEGRWGGYRYVRTPKVNAQENKGISKVHARGRVRRECAPVCQGHVCVRALLMVVGRWGCAGMTVCIPQCVCGFEGTSSVSRGVPCGSQGVGLWVRSE